VSKQLNKKIRVFSIELKSKRHLKNITLTNECTDNVLLEGSIGELLTAKFAEGIILEVTGKDGVIRIDLEETEIQKTSNTQVIKEVLNNE